MVDFLPTTDFFVGVDISSWTSSVIASAVTLAAIVFDYFGMTLTESTRRTGCIWIFEKMELVMFSLAKAEVRWWLGIFVWTTDKDVENN